MAGEQSPRPMADDMERTALGIVMALERDDPAALRELFFTRKTRPSTLPPSSPA